MFWWLVWRPQRCPFSCCHWEVLALAAGKVIIALPFGTVEARLLGPKGVVLGLVVGREDWTFLSFGSRG